ncbi:glycosyltransferase [Paenibacillus sp. PL2-23]|uniref:tetratricopeptide repeat-containing glycosyltransferase n=1 Tax=Paenibacillus sp. PL2-23 TaxID=2100729 RepID=UPI0030F5ACEE
MSTVSACILVKEQNKFLRSCLDSIYQYVDEIVIANNGPRGDVDFARQEYGAIVVEAQEGIWDGARNHYMNAATKSWILVVDVDECLSTQALINIYKHINDTSERTFGFLLPRYEYLGEGQWAYTQLLRLFRNHPEVKYGPHHIHASPGKSIVKLRGEIQVLNDVAIHHFDILFHRKTALKRNTYMSRLYEELREDPQNPHFHYYLGLEYAAQGYISTAEKYFQESISLDRTGRATQRARLYLSQLYLSLDQLNEAEDQIKKMLEKNSEYMDRGYMILSEIFLRRNMKTLSIEYGLKALEANPAAAHHHVNYASLIASENPALSLRHIAEAIRLNAYLLNPMIYKPGERPNVFQLQNCFLSSTINVYSQVTDLIAVLRGPNYLFDYCERMAEEAQTACNMTELFSGLYKFKADQRFTDKLFSYISTIQTSSAIVGKEGERDVN